MSAEKYDYSVSLSEEDVQNGATSQAKLLQMVSPQSTVLECGPAYGIMTRYMKEKLDCRVYIIELDKAGFEHTRPYAEGGVCANLEDDAWMEQIPVNFFDYILYADVLEHLREPQAVLAKMRRFLKPTGSVLLSVPNVAHGDIIMNLMCDQFTYTPTGLLDNTHIHLFARKNLHEMIQSAGYHLYKESCIRVQPFCSEQGRFLPASPKTAVKLGRFLRHHTTRDVFQFICQLTLIESVPVSDIEQGATSPLSYSQKLLKRILYHWMNQHPFTRRIHKAQWILRHKGVAALWKAGRRYWEGRQTIKALGIPWEQIGKKEGYQPYCSQYQADQDFSRYHTDVKLLAFYLPQYYAIPENDAWWGKGFTEWDNVKSGTARFEGHYQPRVPHDDIGYYCLEDISVMRRQAELAKQHGIYGFCFYYYWFSGKRLLEKPVDMLLEHPEIDLPFCLCWANHNWTRIWDGRNKDVLMQQNYSEEDNQLFIRDLKKYLDDSRYIRIHGKPIVLVYQPDEIPNCHQTFQQWRETARQIGIGEILIWSCQTKGNTAKALKIESYVDAEVEFPPHNLNTDFCRIYDVDIGDRQAEIYNYKHIVDIADYKLRKQKKLRLPVHRCFATAWDNAARRKNNWTTFYAYSLESLYKWVSSIVKRTQKDFPPEEQFAFVNAWNEWGEGTYLEPDKAYGYANINTVSRALFNLPLKTKNEIEPEGGRGE